MGDVGETERAEARDWDTQREKQQMATGQPVTSTVQWESVENGTLNELSDVPIRHHGAIEPLAKPLAACPVWEI